MTIREDEAAHIRQAVRDLIDGASVRSVLRDWSDRSVVTPRGEEHDEELEAAPLPSRS